MKALVTVLIASAIGAWGQAKAPLVLLQSIPLPGLHDGDFDHFAVDLAGHRLFLTAEKNAAVEVFDLQTNKLIHTLTDIDEPHSMIYRADLKKLFVIDGGAAEVKIDSDSVEALALEKSGSRMFVNITGKDAVGVIDREKRTVIATWPIGQEGKHNVAMAFDEAAHRLFISTNNPERLIVLNSDSGAIVASLPCGHMVDDLAYDAKSKQIYVTGSDFVDVFHQKDADHYEQVGQIASAFRAKTAILVPELKRYYLAVPRHEDKVAEVRVFEVQP